MIVEKNGRLYGRGTGFGGSTVVNPNIFSDSEEFETSWIFTQAKIRRLSEEREKLRKQIRFNCMTRQNKRKAIFRAIYVAVSFISVFGFFILSTLLY